MSSWATGATPGSRPWSQRPAPSCFVFDECCYCSAFCTGAGGCSARPRSARRTPPAGRGANRDTSDRQPVTCSPAICCACSRVPPFDRYAVIPVARNVWQHVEGGSPAAEVRRLIIARMEERRLRLIEPGLLDVGVEGRGCPVVRRDVVPLAALLVEPQPPPAPPPEVSRGEPGPVVSSSRRGNTEPRVSAVQSRPKPRGRSTVEGAEVDVAHALEELGGPGVGEGLGELVRAALRDRRSFGRTTVRTGSSAALTAAGGQGCRLDETGRDGDGLQGCPRGVVDRVQGPPAMSSSGGGAR